MPATAAGVYGIVLGRVVAQLRQRRGLSQGDLARHLGVAQSTLSRIEAGQILPDAYTLHRIAEALGLSDAELTATIARAMERTEAASAGATGRTSRGTEWWQVALAVAGAAGLAALVGFAVAAVLREEGWDEEA